jgi:serine/threonine-protein kinase HipA
MSAPARRAIEVWADWRGLGGPRQVGVLHATPSRGRELFAFEYQADWLAAPAALALDPQLRLFAGPQFATDDRRPNFGVFLDSSPDRWGRTLIRRREERAARKAGRKARPLLESDYLLGVYDLHRIGALRFKLDPAGPFLDASDGYAAPPWTSIRDLEYASLQLERQVPDDEEERWLRMLIAPGGSLGGTRPKASVLDEHTHLWIAKFPSRADAHDVGAWEMVVHELASRAGVAVPPAQVRRFNRAFATFLTRRFDREEHGERLHFTSALTLLGRVDGDDAAAGASYLELADLLVRAGARTDADLEQLWRRIVFNMCVSNTDDHLRNHGFLLESGKGWALAPAFDMNPVADGDGLRLNVSEADNAQDLGLARSVAHWFRVKPPRAGAIVAEVADAVRAWRDVARREEIGRPEQDAMARAFRLVEQSGAAQR